MKIKLKKDLTFKSGLVWKKGDECSVSMFVRPDGTKSDTMAEVFHVPSGKQTMVKATQLHLFSDEFVRITEEDLQTAMMDGTCPSLTGCDVEPDGHDPEGFPSILMAAGIC